MAPKQEHFFIHTFISFQCIQFVKKQYFLSQTTGKRGERILDYVPFWGPEVNLTGQNWHIAHLDHLYYKIRLQLGLWDTYILRFFFFGGGGGDKVPLCGPRGSGLDQNCTCTTRPWGQQNVTINRSLWYLDTEEIEEQDIVYRQTAGRRTKGYRISSPGLRPVELKIGTHENKAIHITSLLENDTYKQSTSWYSFGTLKAFLFGVFVLYIHLVHSDMLPVHLYPLPLVIK